jgi:hypothetical protein
VEAHPHLLHHLRQRGQQRRLRRPGMDFMNLHFGRKLISGKLLCSNFGQISIKKV